MAVRTLNMCAGRTSPRSISIDLFPQLLRDSARDLRAVKASVLDEDFVRVHARHDDPGEIDALPLAFQRVGIRARLAGFRIERDAVGIEKRKIRTVADHR